MGEPAGVGGEVTLKAWTRRGEGLPPFFVIDDPDRLAGLARRLGLHVPLRILDHPAQAAGLFEGALPVLPERLPHPVVPGRLDAANAPAVLSSIKRAVALTVSGDAAALVTNPIHKQALYEANFPHPGHTEFLAALAGAGTRPVMMLACTGLRVVPVTIHVGLRQAVDTLSTEMIVFCGRVTAQALITDFGIARPRLAVAALNPHAGEGGNMGTEEAEIITPAIEVLRREGILVLGPAPSDTLFHAKARTTYDAVLCMYHDQALIPLKTIDFAGGINVTLGLPFVRTSPDHGTALDIAGSGRADETSLISALRAADEISARRYG